MKNIYSAYSASVGFFSQEIADNGAVSTLEKYFFGEEANADGIHMLTRVVSGAYVGNIFFFLSAKSFKLSKRSPIYPYWSTFSFFLRQVVYLSGSINSML